MEELPRTSNDMFTMPHLVVWAFRYTQHSYWHVYTFDIELQIAGLNAGV